MRQRAWFQADDGTYYRNIPLVMAEQDQLINTLLPWRYRALQREWQQAWRDGTIRTSRIGRRDRIATAASFRDAYPDKPGLWVLDEGTTT